MTISQKFLEQLRNRLTLSDVIGKRIKVTRAGREHKSCCPFHKENTPSFTINDDKQFYHCFGCGAHGDVVNFVMQHDNISFVDAVEQLASQAGLQVPKQSKAEIQKEKKKKNLYDLMNDASAWFEQQLSQVKNSDVMEYLSQRGFEQEQIKGFRIGFAPNSPQDLREYLKSREYSDSQMIEAALVKPGQDGREPYVFFRDRVMVPVLDRQGRIVAFGGRVLPDYMRPPDRSNFTPAKYMNSAETAIFNKSEVLYGEPQARQAAANNQSVLVTEGYFDVMACHQAGFTGAVAPMGTALTEGQILKLWQMIPVDIKEPILCFDGDNAGRRAAERAVERILPLISAGKSARFAFLPEGEDPDSLIQSMGASGFQKILDRAISLVDFLWQMHISGKSFETPESRASLVQKLNEQVKLISDRDVQYYYDSAIRSKVSEFFYRKRSKSNKAGSGSRGFGNRQASKNAGLSLSSPSKRMSDVSDRILIACLINHPGIFESVEEQFGLMHFSNESCEKVANVIISCLSENPDLDSEGVALQIKRRGLEKFLDHIVSPSTYMHGKFAAPSDCEAFVVTEKWLELYNSRQKKLVENEIKTGWKRAFKSSSEEEEERVKALMIQKSGT